MRPLQLVLFAGTTEGRCLAQALARAGVNLLACVATEYGAGLLQPEDNLQVHQGRMNADEMAGLLEQTACGFVVDATHPYAKEVSDNIRSACSRIGTRYLRLVRGTWDGAGVVTAPDTKTAAEILAGDRGRVLLTVGSKELEAFVSVPDYRERLFARVLPSPEVVAACNKLGFGGNRLICMQGPFTHEMNVAMLKQVKADWLVTKDSGGVGGFYEKLSAAKEAGVKLLVIQRPEAETGLEYEDMKALLCRELGCILPEQKGEIKEMPPRFPLFVALAGKTTVMVGGGKVAERRIHTLLACGADVVVIAPEVTEGIGRQIQTGNVRWEQRTYTPAELAEWKAGLVVAATDDRLVNQQVGMDAAQAGIHSSIADAPDEGDFWFPALITGQNLVAGMVSANGDHRAVKRAARELRREWEDSNENSENRQ